MVDALDYSHNFLLKGLKITPLFYRWLGFLDSIWRSTCLISASVQQVLWLPTQCSCWKLYETLNLAIVKEVKVEQTLISPWHELSTCSFYLICPCHIYMVPPVTYLTQIWPELNNVSPAKLIMNLIHKSKLNVEVPMKLQYGQHRRANNTRWEIGWHFL